MGNDAIPTKINMVTTKVFKIKIFLLVISAILFFILIMCFINIAWATNSNIMKPKSTKRLKNLYKSISNWIPSKTECIIKNNAEPTPKNKKYLFLLKSLLIVCINLFETIFFKISNSSLETNWSLSTRLSFLNLRLFLLFQKLS